MNWDLTKLYPSIEKWEEDYQLLSKDINKLQAFQGKLGDFKAFKEYFLLQKSVGTKLLKAYQYVALASDLNKKDTEKAARVQRMMALFSQLRQITAFESPELIAIGRETIDSL